MLPPSAKSSAWRRRKVSGRIRSGYRWVVGTLTLAVLRVSAAIPYNWTGPLGNLFGLIAYYCVPRIRRVGLANLDLAYGDSLTESEKRRILKKSAQNIAKVGLRFAHVPTVGKHAGGELFAVRGAEHVDIERGGLIATAHLGNWEYLGVIGEALGLRGGGIVRPFDDPRVNAIVDGIRRSGGFETIPKDGAGTRLINLIKDGQFVVVVIDQSARENAVPTQFFGHRCWSTFAPAMIAVRTKAPIYPAFVVEESDGTYTLLVRPRIEWERTGDMRRDLVTISQKCQDAIEAVVREYPEQWLWFHRRWKARPKLDAEWREKEERERLRAANL